MFVPMWLSTTTFFVLRLLLLLSNLLKPKSITKSKLTMEEKN